MKKVDLSKTAWRELYQAKTEPALVTVPSINYLVVDGDGGPDGPDFTPAVEALYKVAYTLKFMVKKGEAGIPAIDFKVLPLEAQWYLPNMKEFSMDNKGQWQWSAMIPVPDFITAKMVELTREAAAKKRDLPALPKLRLEKMSDGLSAQIMHVGPYSTEPATIVRLHEFIAAQGHKLTGRHREIYLGDPRRTAPEKLKTILRQPCR